MRERASRLPFSVISINPAAQVSLYRQLYDEFRAAIPQAALAIPSKKGVSRATSGACAISTAPPDSVAGDGQG